MLCSLGRGLVGWARSGVAGAGLVDAGWGRAGRGVGDGGGFVGVAARLVRVRGLLGEVFFGEDVDYVDGLGGGQERDAGAVAVEAEVAVVGHYMHGGGPCVDC